MKIKNNGPTLINNSRFKFDYIGNISSIRDVLFISKIGNHYVIESSGLKSVIVAGEIISFEGSGDGASSSQLQNAVVVGN